MSDVGWGSDHLEPPKKRTIPLWVMGCAGGCMFAIGAGAVAAFFAVPKVNRWLETQTKTEVQWPKLAEALPFDEQPAGFTITHWFMPFPDLWQLESKSRDLVIYVLAAPDTGNGKGWGEWLASPKQAPMFATQEGEFETVEGSLMLQGRELRCVHFTRTGIGEATHPAEPSGESTPRESTGESDMQDPKGDVFDAIERNKSIRGNGLAIDVTQEGSDRRVIVWMVRGKAGATLSDEEAKAILAPFQIGPGH